MTHKLKIKLTRIAAESFVQSWSWSSEGCIKKTLFLVTYDD